MKTLSTLSFFVFLTIYELITYSSRDNTLYSCFVYLKALVTSMLVKYKSAKYIKTAHLEKKKGEG